MSAEVLISVEQVRPEITWPLRAEVLRPGRSPREVAFPGEDDPAAAHFAAFADDRVPVDTTPGSGRGQVARSRVVGVASVLKQPETDGPEPVGSWQLRGMAVSPEQRGRGIGALLLERVHDHVARSGGGLLWCNARVSVIGFYEAEGWTALGEPWDQPEIGPHIRMHAG